MPYQGILVYYRKKLDPLFRQTFTIPFVSLIFRLSFYCLQLLNLCCFSITKSTAAHRFYFWEERKETPAAKVTEIPHEEKETTSLTQRPSLTTELDPHVTKKVFDINCQSYLGTCIQVRTGIFASMSGEKMWGI